MQLDVHPTDREKSPVYESTNVASGASSSASRPKTRLCRVCFENDHAMEKYPFVVNKDKLIACPEANWILYRIQNSEDRYAQLCKGNINKTTAGATDAMKTKEQAASGRLYRRKSLKRMRQLRSHRPQTPERIAGYCRGRLRKSPRPYLGA